MVRAFICPVTLLAQGPCSSCFSFLIRWANYEGAVWSHVYADPYTVLEGQCLSLVCDAQLLRPASVLRRYVGVLSFSQQTCTTIIYQERELYSNPG